MRVAVIFDNLGPYHKARLRAAASQCELLGVQVNADSAEYRWITNVTETHFRFVTLFNDSSRPATGSKIVNRLANVLQDFKAEVVFVPGWSNAAALAAIQWCVEHSAPAVVMSESTLTDERRLFWKEWIKRRIVSSFSAALVGGRPQLEYLEKLQMSRERVFQGYDAVENGHFAKQAEKVRNRDAETRREYGLPENYFLASARFVPKKNLCRLLEAYARYRSLCETEAQEKSLWQLVILGDGLLRSELNAQCSRLKLQDYVVMPGFKQYSELPIYYGLAKAFVHASTTEQWGLVVNEAMASGLPVLVSSRCGCATDLVREDVNGFLFDPYDVHGLARRMVDICRLTDAQRSAMGSESKRIIAQWGPERFASGFRAAAEKALEVGPKSGGLIERILRGTLALR